MASFTENNFTDNAKLKALSALPYKEQAIVFLNAFWTRTLCLKDHPEQREQIWSFKERCVKLDKRGEQGFELDEFNAHRLLEATEGALTVQEMRRVLSEVRRSVGPACRPRRCAYAWWVVGCLFTQIDADFNKHVSLTEFLVYKVRHLSRLPTGTGPGLTACLPPACCCLLLSLSSAWTGTSW